MRQHAKGKKVSGNSVRPKGQKCDKILINTEIRNGPVVNEIGGYLEVGNTRLSHSATQQNTRAVGSTKNYNRASEGIIDPAPPPVKNHGAMG